MDQRKAAYFDEIVGLRIYLALWVAVGHGLQLAGYRPTNAALSVLMEGHAPVVVFMIVSGFVITNLLLVKQESYPRYITRRFFRLYPAYILCCIAGYFVADNWVAITDQVPWRADPWWIGYTANIHEQYRQTIENFWPHAALHGAMIHGAVPDQILQRAPMIFLPAAWSISLEWQFYLVAPLVIAALGKGWRVIALAAISFVLLVAYRKGLLGHYAIPATLAANMQFFLIGIASRLGYHRLAALPLSPLVVSAMAMFGIVALGQEQLPLLVWFIFLAYSLWHARAPVTGAVFRTMMLSKPAKLLGEASYSLYLVHRPAQIALASMALGLIPITHATMLGVQMGAIAIALPISIAMYFTIERGGIELGRRIAARLPGTRPAARPAEPAVSLG